MRTQKLILLLLGALSAFYLKAITCEEVLDQLGQMPRNYSTLYQFGAELRASDNPEEAEYGKFIGKNQEIGTHGPDYPNISLLEVERRVLAENVGKTLKTKYGLKNPEFFGSEIAGTLTGSELLKQGPEIAKTKYLITRLKLVETDETQLKSALGNSQLRPLFSRLHTLDLSETNLGNSTAEALAKSSALENLTQVDFSQKGISGNAKSELDAAIAKRKARRRK